jgi:Polyprenyl synthetase
MDDATVRRGKPATHVAFGEAMAILAAFGLLNGAFSSIARGYAAATTARDDPGTPCSGSTSPLRETATARVVTVTRCPSNTLTPAA